MNPYEPKNARIGFSTFLLVTQYLDVNKPGIYLVPIIIQKIIMVNHTMYVLAYVNKTEPENRKVGTGDSLCTDRALLVGSPVHI